MLDHIPGIHDVHALDPAKAHDPAMQVPQDVLLDAPALGDAEPAAQFKQDPESEAPTLDEYVPTMQLTQAAALVASGVVEYVPATQAVHTLDPDEAHAPVAQAMQVLS